VRLVKRHVFSCFDKNSANYFYDQLYDPYDLAMENTADVTCGNPSPISGESAVNSLVTFYAIQERKTEVVFFCSVPITS
jgi:hypothetical protein